MAIITITTDFGLADGYVGIMKGVILGIMPDVQLIDLSHDIAPQDVRQAAYILSRAIPFFPGGTVHLVVVDPGVGSQRRSLVVQTPSAAYVGPDNGVFSFPLLAGDAQAYELDQPAYWLPEVSHTFHGRDVFAPVAAHLARGVSPARLGRPIADPVRHLSPMPIRHADGHISGQVIYADRFGNLITNIPSSWVTPGRFACRVAGHEIARLSAAYAEVAPGALVALVSSDDTVEIAVRDGNAARRLGAGAGEPVAVWPNE
jgi:S-adenosylmethionine hydrolase